MPELAPEEEEFWELVEDEDVENVSQAKFPISEGPYVTCNTMQYKKETLIFFLK